MNTNHSHVGADPIESDGISYRGIVWFIVILAITVLLSDGIVVGGFKWLDHEVKSADPPRAPLAAPAGQLPPAPNLLYLHSGSPELSEPGNLQQFRAKEDAILNSYSLDKSSGVARLPIERAKALLLQRGLPTRGVAAAAAAPVKASGTSGK